MSQMDSVVRPTERSEYLKRIQEKKMAVSAESYVRGSTLSFYTWLRNLKHNQLPESPPMWICGDCHYGNLGPTVSKNDDLAILIRDFDQTVIGNAAYDIIRLALSFVMAARGSDLSGVTTTVMLARILDDYQTAFLPRSSKVSFRPDAIAKIMHQASRRTWKNLVSDQMEGKRRVLPLGPRFWPLSEDERTALALMFEGEDLRKLVTLISSRPSDDAIELLDAAYWRKGCSSLGLLRVAALVKVGKGKNRHFCLIDIKEAVAPNAPQTVDCQSGKSHADRVVEGARHLSPYLGDRMLSTSLLGKAVFVRELRPQDLKIQIDKLTRDEATDIAGYLAFTIGKSHARQLTAKQRNDWLKTLNAPSQRGNGGADWLWKSVSALVGLHEVAYLAHCREFALSTILATGFL